MLAFDELLRSHRIRGCGHPGVQLGNFLAVFLDPGDLSDADMQRIAGALETLDRAKFSETTFVSATRDDSYDVRITVAP